MKIEIITLFPQMFAGFLETGVLGRAIKNKLIEVKLHDMRKWAWNSYRAVDDKPFGGGVGMLIRVDVIDKALTEIGRRGKKVLAMSAKGKKFDQETAERLAKEKSIVLLCGRYEGFDQRILDNLADETISVGDFVLSGGELGAMTVTDAVVRLLPGVLGKDESNEDESFAKSNDRKVEYPQYTRPESYKGLVVPKILLSGDHQKIEDWRERKRR
jgi:tRNA (guanine37-N1)-methyltransferase